ncbi:MAG: polysaccharide deacetylase [Candidatus Omnitrophica bacterium CG12_big_fil_rev_8_21_14_0_65_43_15]|uniref:Polysaccharide deacetylase n=1 Tax=Candidatus Taenaricola geysiri TaxID=1974752 RepID=A0A2J0LMN5_9BACT|nr:MAG: hypothetical protein AUJ89_05930 [Candidatus Omnitrophica bacterium CG1_02_43_210]PIR65643.1 MAG: polysaccharide deacetylase [Candidatus Omnitrophica bacterium CG10_big_fil_rev_8_21_14_0_10_43_8]PIV11484.1 MAG: polysaccharide deacetylase [Candidatus Omnitrophica bacterium CG03_land_8_20_14_0_80_43_22]PIW66843.1 MAG: polysaccharide deacetylase [Candidatus Omnitrophica bacterium CG12_big_fil_rev_8_21_14_0_65_43_15]PIY84180.1 MAG: polysaccharide deacetylase [Candidatus Omnitrophica bacteri
MIKLKNLKFLFIFLLFAFLVFAFLYLPSERIVPIFMYHNIDEKNDMLSVSPQNFDKQMRFLSQHNYNVIGLGEFANLITAKKNIPPNTVLITFDDGKNNLYENALPILKKYQIKAAMFVIPGNCGQKGYLDKKQIREISEAGIDIGSHTLTDKWLPACNDAELKREIYGSRNALEIITGRSVYFISYPLGGFDERVKGIVKSAGYRAACATHPGLGSATDDVYALKRVKITNKDAQFMISFWLKATGCYEWYKEQRRAYKKSHASKTHINS